MFEYKETSTALVVIKPLCVCEHKIALVFAELRVQC